MSMLDADGGGGSADAGGGGGGAVVVFVRFSLLFVCLLHFGVFDVVSSFSQSLRKV